MAEIGFQSAVFIDGNDVTEVLNEASIASPMGAVDRTTFRPPNNSRQYLAGLISETIQLKGFLDLNAAEAEKLLSRTVGNRAGQQVLVGVGGLDVGNLAYFAKSQKTSMGVNIVTDGMVTANADFQVTAGSPGVCRGVVLSTPHGSSALASSEQQTLVFTNVPASQQFAFRKTGGSTLSAAWTAADDNATRDSRLEELYGAGTLTVTGSLTTSTDGVTGETLYSGTLTLAYGGSEANTDVPQVRVITGEAHRYLVTSGDGGTNYGYGGSTGAALGFNAAAFQSAIRATSGRSGVVVAGSSTAPVTGSLSLPVHDATSNSAVVTATSLTWSHTVGAGSNRYLKVAVIADNAPDTVTWKGTPMALLSSSNKLYVYGLVAPASGAGSVVVSVAAGGGILGTASSYTNVDQSTPLDVAAVVHNSASTSQVGSITTANANSILLESLAVYNDNATANSSQVARGEIDAFSIPGHVYTTEKAAVAAGTFTESWTITSNSTSNLILIALRGHATIDSAGTAAFDIYYRPSDGDVATPSPAGTGAVVTKLEDGAADAAHIAVATTIPGSRSVAVYNPVSATGNGADVADGTADTAFGGEAVLQTLPPVGATPSLTVKIQHAPDSAGSPGSYTDLLTFDAMTAKGAQRQSIAPGVTIHPHLQAVVTAISGTFVFSVAFARNHS